jgi:hypothetical protein
MQGSLPIEMEDGREVLAPLVGGSTAALLGVGASAPLATLEGCKTTPQFVKSSHWPAEMTPTRHTRGANNAAANFSGPAAALVAGRPADPSSLDQWRAGVPTGGWPP